jgi:hypothetical protein
VACYLQPEGRDEALLRSSFSSYKAVQSRNASSIWWKCGSPVVNGGGDDGQLLLDGAHELAAELC